MLLGVSSLHDNEASVLGTFPVDVKEVFDWTSQIIYTTFFMFYEDRGLEMEKRARNLLFKI